MGFGTIEQLIAKGAPSPITSALQGFQTGAGIMPGLQKQRLANQLLQAQIAKAQRPDIQGAFAQNIAGLMQIAKQRGLTPVQTSQLLDQFQQSQQKKGISLGFGQGGGLTSLNIGGTPGIAGVAGGGTGVGLLSPTAIVPNSGQTSRGTMGATKINPDTGAVTSIPTRATGGFLQQGIVGVQKLKSALNDYTNGMLPYAGGAGHLKFGLDLAKSAMGDKEASQRLTNYYTAKGNRIAIATDAARMMTGKSPAEGEINKWLNSVNPGFWEKPELFKGHMEQFKTQADKWKKISQKGLETGIPVSQLSPQELKSLQAAQQIGQSQPTLGQLFFPDDEHVAALHALKQPQHLINGVPHLKPDQTAGIKAPIPALAPQKATKASTGLIKASDGRSYSREELQRIAQGGG